MLEVLAFAGLVVHWAQGGIARILKRRKATAPWNGYVDSSEFYTIY